MASSVRHQTTRTWRVGNQCLQTGRFPLVMGIVNVTPDSFSDGGQLADSAAAVAHALQLIEHGADVIDIGGESTRPGAAPVAVEEELRRVIPLVEQLAQRTETLLSIDTTKAEVARQALRAGARIVNDISGLAFDPQMPAVCAEAEAAVICMHIQGTPQTMQADPRYGDVVSEICDYFEQRLAELESRGIPRERIVLDPGIGFGKTAGHNLEILSHISRFRELGRPVCVGHSRKRFLKKLLGRAVDERSMGSVGISLALAAQSTDILRVHDVAATWDALLAWRAVMDRVESEPLPPPLA